MSRLIVKIRDCYLDWSTVVDAPVTNGMTLAEFRSYYLAEYGPDSEVHFEESIKLADANGASDDYNWRTANRAGPKETFLNEDELYQVYCLGADLDAETVQQKLREQEEEANRHRSVATPLSDQPTNDEIDAACNAIENGCTLSDVEAILGKGDVIKRKRRPDVIVRWYFEEKHVECHFGKSDGTLQGVIVNANYKSKAK